MPNSAPDMPVISTPLAISGASVIEKPSFHSSAFDFQTSLPVLASSAITWASSVVRKTLPSKIAAPLLDTPQQTTRGVSAGQSSVWRQICLPVPTSIATVCRALVTYMTPLWTIGCACSPHWLSRLRFQTGTSRFTVFLLISLSRL